MKKWRYCILILIVFVLLVLPVVANTGKLAYSPDWNDISKINVMGANGGSQTWLTDNSSGMRAPVMEPNEVPVSMKTSLAALRLSFVPNVGQIQDAQVKFMIKASGSSLFFTPDAIYLTAMSGDEGNQTSQVIRQSFLGANRNPAITGIDILTGTANFLFGSDPKYWQQDVPTYGKIVYHDLYPGIDLSFFGNDGHLKREFIVAPGADPSAITFAFEGVSDIKIDTTGALHLATGTGEMVESPPLCYQVINGKKVPVNAWYVISEDQTITVRLDHYDPSYALVIDPELIYATYYGGSGLGNEFVFDIAVDSSGTAYITGTTDSPDFLTTPGAVQTIYGGVNDVFVVKLNPTGSAPIYSTYYGGTDLDEGYGITVDNSGNAYITGTTNSRDFLTTPGAVQTTKTDNYDDAFVVKLNPTGSAPVYATYYGGTSHDWGSSIAVDNSGNAYITGITYSFDFPTTPGAAQTTDRSSWGDAFVVRLNPTGSAPVYATYYGGTRTDYGQSIAVDNSGNAYITGYTDSSDFPTTPGVVNSTFIGNKDAFVVKLNPTGSAPVYATYYGGTYEEGAVGIAVDSSGNAYFAGSTHSLDFLTTPGALQTAYNGWSDAFIVKLNPTGSAPVYSTYYGGTDLDEGFGITIDNSGSAYITGNTVSTDFLTTPGVVQPAHSSGWSRDAFVVKLNLNKGTLSPTGFHYPTDMDAKWENGGGEWLADDDEIYVAAPQKYHTGRDIMGAAGRPVYSISEGTILSIDNNPDWSFNVGDGLQGLFIQHDTEDGMDFVALYGHIKVNTSLVNGDPVTLGQEIGTIGNYDNQDHLHFGIRPGTTYPSPWGVRDKTIHTPNGFVDPMNFIDSRKPGSLNTPYNPEIVVINDLNIVQNGNTMIATFTIKNKSGRTITLDDLGVGGRYKHISSSDGTLPSGVFPDFQKLHNIVLTPSTPSYTYSNRLTIPYSGDYEFFVYYKTSDGTQNWLVPKEDGTISERWFFANIGGTGNSIINNPVSIEPGELFPPGPDTYGTPVFRWDPVTNSMGYRLYICECDGKGSITNPSYYRYPHKNNDVISGTSFNNIPATILKPFKYYCWYVEPKIGGIWGTQSSPLRYFHISPWPKPFSIVSNCPVDISVTDPEGLIIDKTINQIPGATYIELGVGTDGTPDAEIDFAERKTGDYRITVTPKTGASPTDTFTLKVLSDGETQIIAKNVAIKDIQSHPYSVQVTSEGKIIIGGGEIPSPEFPSIFLPAAMIIGFLGAVLLIQRTREQ
jgi:hypothetical protein